LSLVGGGIALLGVGLVNVRGKVVAAAPDPAQFEGVSERSNSAVASRAS
jgi:hypothetical protein